VTATSPAAWAYDFGTVFCIAMAKKCAMIGLASASPAFMFVLQNQKMRYIVCEFVRMMYEMSKFLSCYTL